jgi:hypothetical protein
MASWQGGTVKQTGGRAGPARAGQGSVEQAILAGIGDRAGKGWAFWQGRA